MERVYACIDLKSFYASVEAVERELDPFEAKIVVADESRGRGAITLAITPALKKLGVKNRCRIYEIPKDIEYIIAKPRMKLYMEYSARIYGIYIKYISPEDIHIYSIDECFIDLTCYLKLYNKSAGEICKMIVDDILKITGITASVGIGTNLFLSKVALDILAKESENYMAFLDKTVFERLIARRRPLTDIWGIGKGTANRLAYLGIYDLEALRRANVDMLYRLFGINARILLDHANGEESCTIEDIKKYRSKSRSISNSQILFEDYDFDDAKNIMSEMLELLCLELLEMGLETANISLRISYSNDITKSTGKSMNLKRPTNHFKELNAEFRAIYEKTTNRNVGIRQISISLNGVKKACSRQLNLFEKPRYKKDENIQKVMLNINKKYGKNTILRARALTEKSTIISRNKMIGGHNAGR